MRGKLIERVVADSIAEELGIISGDRVITINDTEPSDILDWQLVESTEELLLTIQQQSGELVEFEIEKDYDEALGIVFPSPTLDKIHACQNRCVFCFVDQMPADMRETLYIKDDDYRLSFLSGSYITLTNINDEDMARIMRLHLSPLYVSVHTTDPTLRQQLMNNKRAGELLPIMKRLAAAGIEFHTQVVLCPGLNDGEALAQTITDLYALYPAVRTLAVVPVGLTGHRAELYPLTVGDQTHAQEVLDQLTRWQERSLAAHDTRFVFASDEFYTMAGMRPPPAIAYEGYPQLENGVGLVRILLDEWNMYKEKLPIQLQEPTVATIITGVSASFYLQPMVERLNQIENVQLTLLPVENQFFGGKVTVAGLLTFQDIKSVIDKIQGTLYLPTVMLKEGRELFLDGYTSNDLASAANVDVHTVNSLGEFLEALLGKEMR